MADKLIEGIVNKPKAIPLQPKFHAFGGQGRNHYFVSTGMQASLHISLTRLTNRDYKVMKTEVYRKSIGTSQPQDIPRTEKRVNVPFIKTKGKDNILSSLSNYTESKRLKEDYDEEDSCSIDSEDHILNLPFPLKIHNNKAIFKKRSNVVSNSLYYFIIQINRQKTIRNKVIFNKICSYCDVVEILKLMEIVKYKQLKDLLKDKVYQGLNTKRRMDYWIAIGKLCENKRKYKFLYIELWITKSKYEAAIIADVSRTYPSLSFFNHGQEGYNKLFRILKAISLKFPLIGYCQGLNFFAAVILLTLCNEEVSV